MPSRVVVPLIVACALFMQNLDSTCLATSLPAIAASLDEPPVRLHLAITSYLLALAVFLPISGWVADRFGARLIFRVAIGIFSIGSIMCAVSATFPQLIVARLVQGLGGAMMVPVGRLILVRSVEKSELVAAMVLMSMPAVVGPVMGPLLGGFITTYASWRWIFWINVPVGIFGIYLVTKFIEEVREPEVKRFDWIGFFLSGFGLGGTLFAMDTGSIGHGGADLVSLGFFVGRRWSRSCSMSLHAARVDNPISISACLKITTFRVSVTGGSVFRLGVGAVPFLLPLLMQEGFGYNPFQSGAITFVSAAGAFGMRTIARRVLRRFGFRTVLDLERAHRQRFHLPLRDLSMSTRRARFHDGDHFLRRRFSLARIHEPQRHRFRRYRIPADEPRDELATDGAARLAKHGCGDLGLPPAFCWGATAPSIPTFAWAFTLIGLISATSAISFIRLQSDAGAVLSGRGMGEHKLARFRAK